MTVRLVPRSMMQSHVPSSHSNSMPVQVSWNSLHLVLHWSRFISLLRHSHGFSSRFSCGSMTRLLRWVISQLLAASPGPHEAEPNAANRARRSATSCAKAVR